MTKTNMEFVFYSRVMLVYGTPSNDELATDVLDYLHKFFCYTYNDDVVVVINFVDSTDKISLARVKNGKVEFKDIHLGSVFDK